MAERRYTSDAELQQRQQRVDRAQRNIDKPGFGGLFDAFKSGREKRSISEALRANASISASENEMRLQQAMSGSANAAPGVLKPGAQYQFQSPEAQQGQLAQALGQQQAQQAAEAEANRIRPVSRGTEMWSPAGGVSHTNTNVAGPLVSNTVNPTLGGGKYADARGTAQAEAFQKLEDSANSAFQSNQMLDSFVAASPNADAGGAEPVISAIKNFMTSFGIPSESLTSTAIMEQAIGGILGQKMAELGARGLTDKDMEVLKSSLPRINTDHKARLEVAAILRKQNDFVISQYSQDVENENERYPNQNFRRPPWLENYDPNAAPVAPAASTSNTLNYDSNGNPI